MIMRRSALLALLAAAAALVVAGLLVPGEAGAVLGLAGMACACFGAGASAALAAWARDARRLASGKVRPGALAGSPAECAYMLGRISMLRDQLDAHIAAAAIARAAGGAKGGEGDGAADGE